VTYSPRLYGNGGPATTPQSCLLLFYQTYVDSFRRSQISLAGHRMTLTGSVALIYYGHRPAFVFVGTVGSCIFVRSRPIFVGIRTCGFIEVTVIPGLFTSVVTPFLGCFVTSSRSAVAILVGLLRMLATISYTWFSSGVSGASICVLGFFSAYVCLCICSFASIFSSS